MRIICLLCFIVFLAGCQPATLGVYNSPPIVVFNQQEVRSLASTAEGLAYAKGRPVQPVQYDFFSKNSFGVSWLKQRKNRVITVGFPKECATYNSRWGHSNAFAAVEMTMSTCLSRVKELGSHIGKKCGCRLAAINDVVLMAPDELPFRKNLPAIALVKDEKGRKEILGYAETTGRTGKNQPLMFFTQSGRKVCDGDYSLGALSTTGEANLNCFAGKIKGPAVFKVAGFREGQAYGTALVNAGENQLILVYGLPTEEFRKRRAELLGQ